jgi:uncharacterized protein (TIRG00374 family)
MSAPGRRIPRWCWTLAKLGIAAAVVAWMLQRDILSREHLTSALANWHWLVIALAALLAGVFLQSIRWGILLRAQGIQAGTLELFILAMTGFFFTLIAPGGIGGDAMKAFYVAKGREKKAEAATTVFLDRFLGLATLFLVAAVMVGFKCRTLWYREVQGLDRFGMPGGRILVLAIAAGVGAMTAFALLVTSKRLRRSQLLKRLSRVVPFRRTLVKVYDAMHLYGDRPGALFAAGAVSVVAQLSFYLIYYLYGLAVGAEIEWWHCALVVPPAMVIRVLPLMPAGAGQGMAAMAVLFPLVGVEGGPAIGAVGDAMFFVVCLIGGLFFVFGKTNYSEMRAAAKSDAAAEQP